MQSKYEKMTKYTLAVNEIKELQDYNKRNGSGLWECFFKHTLIRIFFNPLLLFIATIQRVLFRKVLLRRN